MPVAVLQFKTQSSSDREELGLGQARRVTQRTTGHLAPFIPWATELDRAVLMFHQAPNAQTLPAKEQENRGLPV